MKEIQATVYEAFDGTKFTTKEDCQKYEKVFLDDVRYFAVKHTPDLNETGKFTKVTYLAIVPYRYGNAATLPWNYALKEICNGEYLTQGVQGSGFEANFSVSPCNKEAFDENLGVGWGFNPTHGEQVYIGVKEIPGFPKPFDYRKQWNIN